ncbi:MAG: hypothetical protein ACI89J_000311 [Hyphomicrobiaceae bacterium]|jgi:hypothetical protein
MAAHKYKVGQSLLFSPRRLGHQEGNQSCEILRCLPFEGGEFQYRIKCGYDNVERVARESQLGQQP